MSRHLPRGFVLPVLAAAFVSCAYGFEIKPVDAPLPLAALECRVGGRAVVENGGAAYRFQWPGVYFVAAFHGSEVFFRTGAGRAIYHVVVDDRSPDSDVKWTSPGPGVFRIDGLAAKDHRIRIELATECQGGAVEFDGFFVRNAADARPAPAASPRRIEFIGDSHTVGYGDTSTKRVCTPDEIWSHTDTSDAFGALVARHYGADYRINAISGRGIVRNYGGFTADTLPEAYPFALFDHHTPADDRGWDPQVIVIGLGTNDFSTPLKPGEKWKTRDAEHADFEATYLKFFHELRTKHPGAFFILAANDQADGEIQAEVRKIIARLREQGETNVGYAEFNHLELTGCDWHPSLADHRHMASVLIGVIDAHPGAFPAPSR
ncbi:MAG TPA: GDSL-type esterase/lipase family protein [Opitutaceae bacterium]|nr:GDSL-type esterase/lipase family protein [Opitutaceae bacterium]